MRSRHTSGGPPARAALALLAAGWAALAVSPAPAAEPASNKLIRSAPIKDSDWLRASTEAIGPAEIDRLVGRELRAAGVRPAGRTTDEQFVRRVYLDLTGRLPLPADVTEFVADPDPRKRAKLIDRLLDSDE